MCRISTRWCVRKKNYFSAAKYPFQQYPLYTKGSVDAEKVPFQLPNFVIEFGPCCWALVLWNGRWAHRCSIKCSLLSLLQNPIHKQLLSPVHGDRVPLVFSHWSRTVVNWTVNNHLFANVQEIGLCYREWEAVTTLLYNIGVSNLRSFDLSRTLSRPPLYSRDG